MDTTESSDFIVLENLINEKVSVHQFCRDFPTQIECLFHLLDELEKINKQNRHNMLLTNEQLDEMLLLYNYNCRGVYSAWDPLLNEKGEGGC